MKRTASPSVLFLFPHAIASELRDVELGIAPTERLYGLVELRKSGLTASICDSRFEGTFGRICSAVRRYGIYLIDWTTMIQIWRHDVIVVKDDFSTLVSIVTKLLRKKLVYMDAMFVVPRGRRLLAAKICIRMADSVIAYSQNQISEWSDRLGMPRGKFLFIPYTIDTSFYNGRARSEVTEPYVLAIGRDMGRDFNTLIDAVRGTKLRLNLVTLPYLLPKSARSEDFITVMERLTYEQLFELYSKACLVAVPLKGSVSYPSGIRALFEAALMQTPIVATRTRVLEEYFDAGRDVLFVDPSDPAALRSAIEAIAGDQLMARELAVNAHERVNNSYGMETLARALKHEIHRITSRPVLGS